MRRLVVDGYNVLHADERYRRLAADDLDAARALLVEDVAAYCVGELRGTVVFDGGDNPGADGSPHHIAGVAVLFSRGGVSADSVIEGLAARARERGDRVTIVTSDAATQWTVMGGEVSRMSSAEFVRAIRETGAEWTGHAPVGLRKGALQDRIDASVKAVLSRWARGMPPHEH
ncbi:MAG: RNA-binding protein [Actinobacteria bacterium]|nr:MAG: RNA-binding protein [Actinomycetota bacterium]